MNRGAVAQTAGGSAPPLPDFAYGARLVGVRRGRSLFSVDVRPSRDITCDGSVLAETAEIRRCDGVMDRMMCVFRTGNGARKTALAKPNGIGVVTNGTV